MGILTNKQDELTYRGVYGLGDAILDTKLYDEDKIMAKYDPNIIEIMKIKCPSIVDNFMRVKSLIRNLPSGAYEIKSVTNRSYKWIVDKGEISWHYKMQAGFYGLARNEEYFGLVFIASDDLREHVTIHRTREVKAEIDKIIDEYEQMVHDWETNHKVPAWEVHDKWMENPNYMAYDSIWATCSEDEYVKMAVALQDLGLSSKGK
jgi:hypothetical protein